MSSATEATWPDGPHVDEHEVLFVLADRNRRLSSVRLEQELGLSELAFTRARTRWSLSIPRPPVDRMEYLFEVEDANGRRATITDPVNPLRAPGAFGEKSVLTFPGYTEPSWLSEPGIEMSDEEFVVPAPLLDGEITATVWSPAGLRPSVPAPLVVVHDGPEFAALGGLVHYVAAMTAAGAVPPTRVALLAPGERNEWYAANPDYARSLVDAVLPALPAANARIGLGVSLGALAMLHAHRMHPAAFDGLMLQSGSFFTPDLDGQESGFSGFAAVTGFVASVLDRRERPRSGAHGRHLRRRRGESREQRAHRGQARRTRLRRRDAHGARCAQLHRLARCAPSAARRPDRDTGGSSCVVSRSRSTAGR